MNSKHAADPEDKTCSAYWEPAQLCLFNASHSSVEMLVPSQLCPTLGGVYGNRGGGNTFNTTSDHLGAGHIDALSWHNITKELLPRQDDTKA